MGWLWKSSKPSQEAPDIAPLPAATDAHIPPSSPSQPQSHPRSPSTTTPDRTDAELDEFLSQWQDANAASGSRRDDFTLPAASTSPPQLASASSSPPGSLASSTSTPRDISEYALYPREMSCGSAFDYAFFCQSFGGQFVNVYRYGSLRSCSERWSDFWFCMRTNQLPDEERKAAIADHYRKKAVKYKTGPSSEDIWEMRTEPVSMLFQNDYHTAVQGYSME
ncbi:hypothetical protein KEM52_002004 [Ascosphaera acerosa]|nr:hypothetical protein KEM52_002004 [Ascosphaera acerosa]